MGTVVVLALTLLFFLLSYSRKLSKRIVDPIDMLCERLVAIGRGGLLVCEPIQADVEEVQLLSDGIESMVGHLKRLVERNTEQEKQRRRTELALLPPVDPAGGGEAPASGPVFSRRAHLCFFLHDEIIVHTPIAQADRVADAVRRSAARATQILFGTFPLDFPLDLRIAPDAAKS